jgi:hypothetical protein
MDRDIAIRLDGMLIAARANADGIAHYMKSNLSDPEYKRLVISIGNSMAALIDISSALHAEFPDITPKEMVPPAGSPSEAS